MFSGLSRYRSQIPISDFPKHALFTQSIVRCHFRQSFLSHFLTTPISFDLACNQVTGVPVAFPQEYTACLEVTDAMIMRCTSVSDGGAIKFPGAVSLSITGSSVSSFRSDANGGAVLRVFLRVDQHHVQHTGRHSNEYLVQ
jgi:hypothetical protein